MKKSVEIRSYNLKAGQRPQFHRLGSIESYASVVLELGEDGGGGFAAMNPERVIVRPFS